MSAYFEALVEAMGLLAQHPRSIFIGQAVKYKGTAMHGTLRDVPADRILELPVFEDCQMGMATGMAIAGDLPICIFPRWNFLLLAMNQLVLHLDKLPAMSTGGYAPKVIVRTAVATDEPLNPGPQHIGDFTEAVRSMLLTVRVVSIDTAEQIMPVYRDAMEREGPTLLIEHMRLYDA